MFSRELHQGNCFTVRFPFAKLFDLLHEETQMRSNINYLKTLDRDNLRHDDFLSFINSKNYFDPNGLRHDLEPTPPKHRGTPDRAVVLHPHYIH